MPSENSNSGQAKPETQSQQNAPKQGIVAPRRDPEITADHVAEVDKILGFAPKDKAAEPKPENQPKKATESAGDERSGQKPADGSEEELFKPESLFEGDEDEDAGDKPKRRQRSKSFDEFAEANGFEASALLELEIPAEDGEEPTTVKQALERLKTVRNFEQRRDEFEDFHHKAMMEVQNARGQLDGLVGKLMGVVPPETMAAAMEESVNERQAYVDQQRKIAWELMPDWRDKAQRESDLSEMDKFLQGFGFDKGQVRQILDAKMMYFANWAWRLAGRYERAKTRLNQQGKIPTSEPSRRGAKVDQKQQVNQLVDAGQRDAAVDKILGL